VRLRGDRLTRPVLDDHAWTLLGMNLERLSEDEPRRQSGRGGLQVRDTASDGPGQLPIDHMFQDGRR